MPNTNIKIRINNETYQVTTDAQGEYEYIYTKQQWKILLM